MIDGQALLTVKDVADLLAVTKQSVTKRALKESWAFMERSGRGGSVKIFPLCSLPGEIQNKYLAAHPPAYNNKDARGAFDGFAFDAASEPEPTRGEEELAMPIVAASPSLPPTLRGIISAVATIDQGDADPWSAMPESCRNKGYDILLIVNKVRDILAQAPKKEKTPRLIAYAESITYNHRSLYRYLKKADKALLAAQKAGRDTIMAQIQVLAPQHGKTRDRVSAFDRNAVVYALSLYASPEQRNVTEVYNQTVRMAHREHWQVGTYATLLNYIRRLDQATATLGRTGKKAFEADHLIKILRNYDEIPPLFMLCGDHHIFDVFVKLPDGKGGWTFKRPWLTSWLDMRSRSLMGWCVSFAPNSRTIAMALAHAIAPKNDPDFPQFGIPSSVYVDNGKDYRAKYLGGEEIPIGKIDYPDIIERFAALGIDPFYIDLSYDPEQDAWVKKQGDKILEIKGVRVGGVYARLGIGQRYATAYHPWAKPIERFHRTLVQSFSRELPGWCGSGHEQRPEKLSFELRSARTILTIDEFCDRFYNWVVNVYHKTPHRGHGMNGMTPDEAFASLMPAPVSCDQALLDFALMKKENVKIHNWGFNLNGRQFELDVPVNLQGGRILNVLIGTWVTVYYDFDYKTLRIYRDGKYVCDGRSLARASFVTPNDQTMTDKLKLAAYQKRDAAGKIRMLQDAAAESDTVNEAAALLAITQGDGASLPEYCGDADDAEKPEDADQGGREHGDDLPGQQAMFAAQTQAPARDPLDDTIFITPNDRYRGQILKKIARGRELTPEQQAFRESFEASQMYLESKQLYDAQLDYEKYLTGGQR